jgi:hypothetical protein
MHAAKSLNSKALKKKQQKWIIKKLSKIKIKIQKKRTGKKFISQKKTKMPGIYCAACFLYP